MIKIMISSMISTKTTTKITITTRTLTEDMIKTKTMTIIKMRVLMILTLIWRQMHMRISLRLVVATIWMRILNLGLG